MKSLGKGSLSSHMRIMAVLIAALVISGLAYIPTPEQAFADETPAVDQAKTYTIKYKGVSGAKNANPTQVEKGTLKLKAPKKAGYTFKGWYQGKKKVTKVNVKKNLTLTAKWKAKTYKITCKNVKGANKNAKKFTYGKSVKLKKLSKSGYTFMGWYSDKYLTKKVTKVGGKTAKNVTVYAKWVQKPKNAQQKKAVAFAKQVLREVHNYYSCGASKSALIEALREAGFARKDAIFAASNCGANWFIEAKRAAGYYADMLWVDEDEIVDEYYFFTESDLREDLKSRGFKSNEISYAIKHAKIDWVEQAANFLKGYFEEYELSDGAGSSHFEWSMDDEDQWVVSLSPQAHKVLLEKARKKGIDQGIKAGHLDTALKTCRNVDWESSAYYYFIASIETYQNVYGKSPYIVGEHDIDEAVGDLTFEAAVTICEQGVREGFTEDQMITGLEQYLREYWGL